MTVKDPRLFFSDAVDLSQSVVDREPIGKSGIRSLKNRCVRLARLLRTLVLWRWRFHYLGSRSTLGKCRLVKNPATISIGHHTTIGHGWSLADLEPNLKANDPKIRIGSNCCFMHDFQCNARISVEIQDNVLIGPRVFVTDSDHVVDRAGVEPMRFDEFRSAAVVIEHNCWLGVNAVVLKGVRIGHHSVIAANAVVTKDVPPCSTVTGAPGVATSRLRP
jgi:acetyltransferase-like isoleucine patch superfamily enzyme